MATGKGCIEQSTVLRRPRCPLWKKNNLDTWVFFFFPFDKNHKEIILYLFCTDNNENIESWILQINKYGEKKNNMNIWIRCYFWYENKFNNQGIMYKINELCAKKITWNNKWIMKKMHVKNKYGKKNNKWKYVTHDYSNVNFMSFL